MQKRHTGNFRLLTHES